MNALWKYKLGVLSFIICPCFCRLFGPRKKMTNAIARWHSQAPAARSSLEQAYADRLEGEMQEMAIQLNQVQTNSKRFIDLQVQTLGGLHIYRYQLLRSWDLKICRYKSSWSGLTITMYLTFIYCYALPSTLRMLRFRLLL